MILWILLDYFPDPEIADNFHCRSMCKKRDLLGSNPSNHVSRISAPGSCSFSTLVSIPISVLSSEFLTFSPWFPNALTHLTRFTLAQGLTEVFTYSTVIPQRKISGRAGGRGYPNHLQSPAPAIMQHFHQVNNTAGVKGSQEGKSLRAICRRNLNDLFNNTVK